METSTMSIVRRCLRPGSAWLTALLLFMAMICASMGVAHAAETITYYYTSPQGTVLAKADASGNILSNADYRPYGTQALGTPEQGPGYTGHVNDVDSGLVYMQARYYDPTTGRFASIDPSSINPGSVFAMDRYAYANNNPINNIDPDGRDTVGQDIDQNAQQAANEGRNTAAFGWAFVGTFWQAFGAESVSEVVDKGADASSTTKAGAVLEVLAAFPPLKLGKAVVAAESGAKASGIIAKDGLKLEGFTKHGIDRAVGDGAKRAGTKPAAMLDALKNPVKISDKVDSEGRVSRRYIGEQGRVVVNPETGKVISTNPTSGAGAQ